MMRITTFEHTPFQIQISFEKLLGKIEDFISTSQQQARNVYLKDLLNRLRDIPSITQPMQDDALIVEHRELIDELLGLIFPEPLSSNEIKAISMPFQNSIFHLSNRFQQIVDQAGPGFDVSIRNFDQHQYFIACCCIILNYFFKTNFDLSKPLFIDIPDDRGIIRHYRVLYNADFVDLIPTDKAIMLSQSEIEELEENYDDLELWQSKFPQESWMLSGFGLVSLVDVTIESALSSLKSNLLKSAIETHLWGYSLEPIFSSIFKVPQLRIGFTPFEIDETTDVETRELMGFQSFIVNEERTDFALSASAYKSLFEDLKYYTISDVSALELDPEATAMCVNLKRNQVQSCILAPIIVDDQIRGIIEIVSQDKRALHSVNAQKLDSVMPIVIDTFERVQLDLNNQIEAVIQREYTTIHPSVYWKFLIEARRNYFGNLSGQSEFLKDIVFDAVYPVYGEVDIKGSTYLRNKTVVRDLELQIGSLLELLQLGNHREASIVFEKRILKLNAYAKRIKQAFYIGLEQEIQEYIRLEVHPFILQSKSVYDTESLEDYIRYIEPQFETYYRYRRDFDQAVARVNKTLSVLLDSRQEQAQQIFPHYYERFKSDGIDHNIYIGASIAPDKIFDIIYLHNLRLWQLQVFCELIRTHYADAQSQTVQLDLTGLILVYDTALSIRFRMDEKRFDVDGSYHTRYEVIKKRLDKALVKNSSERVVQSKKIAVVFANASDEEEYLRYIAFFQSRGLLDAAIEYFQVEDLQSVSGLTGIRIGVTLSGLFERVDCERLMSDFLKNQYL